jgi:hypothetical protein
VVDKALELRGRNPIACHFVCALAQDRRSGLNDENKGHGRSMAFAGPPCNPRSATPRRMHVGRPVAIAQFRVRWSLGHLNPTRRSPHMTDAVITDIADGIGTLTLNKPWKLNAWDTPMRAEVSAVLAAWHGDPQVRAVILTGAGERAFCAGQDLEETEKFQ